MNTRAFREVLGLSRRGPVRRGRGSTSRVGRIFRGLLVFVGLLGLGIRADEPAPRASKRFQIVTKAFKPGGRIPRRYTGDGRDISPPLTWKNVPPGTKSLVLICFDPDAPGGLWVHWLVYAISPALSGLPAAVPPSYTVPGKYRQGLNSWRRVGYGGPHPPRGQRHRYFFRLFALNTLVTLPGGAKYKQVLAAMRGHVIAQTEIMGTYRR